MVESVKGVLGFHYVYKWIKLVPGLIRIRMFERK